VARSEAEPRLEQRVAALEEHLDFVHGAVRRLRGRVTGAIRHGAEEPDPDGNGGGPVSDAPATVPANAFDRQAYYARLEARGRAVKPS